MNLKVGQYVLVKDVVRSYSKNFDEYFKVRRKLKISSIHKDQTVKCTLCGYSHSPQIMLEVNFDGEDTSWAFTPCEIYPPIEEKLNKLLKL